MLEDTIKELSTAQQTILNWYIQLQSLHKIYKTKPSISWEKLDKMKTQVYYLIEYMQVLTKEALAGTNPSTLAEIISKLDPDTAKLIFGL